MGKKKTNPIDQTALNARIEQQYQNTLNPSPGETEFANFGNQLGQNYNEALASNKVDYGNLMGAYGKFREGLTGPTQFTYNPVTAERPSELTESYGYLREAAPGYREFAATGGYSDKDISELRARGISPIRAAYANTMRNLSRSRALGGAGGSPNYIAAVSRAQREMPQQLADATTDVNAGLAQQIREGKLAGLAGITGIGSTMGGLSSAEANRMLQASLANQDADIKTQGMTEGSLQNLRQAYLSSLGGESGLYGTQAGLTSGMGNQALNAWQQRLGTEASRNQLGASLTGMQIEQANQQQSQKTPWWKIALSAAATAAPYIAMAASDKNLKKNIKSVSKDKFTKGLKNLELKTWEYKGDSVKHLGPMAQEFKKQFGIGDGKTIHLADVMGVLLGAGKESLAHG